MTDGEHPASFEALCPRQAKRLAMIRLHPQIIIDMLKMPSSGVLVGMNRITCIHDPIPGGAEFYSAGVSPSGEIQIVMEHESFDPVYEGCRMRMITPHYRSEIDLDVANRELEKIKEAAK